MNDNKPIPERNMHGMNENITSHHFSSVHISHEDKQALKSHIPPDGILPTIQVLDPFQGIDTYECKTCGKF